jgi:hypothetical protein
LLVVVLIGWIMANLLQARPLQCWAAPAVGMGVLVGAAGRHAKRWCQQDA